MNRSLRVRKPFASGSGQSGLAARFFKRLHRANGRISAVRYRRVLDEAGITVRHRGRVLAGLAATPARAGLQADAGPGSPIWSSPRSSNVKAGVGNRLVGQRRQPRRAHLAWAREHYADRDVGPSARPPSSSTTAWRSKVRHTSTSSPTAHFPAVSLAFTEAKTYLRTPGSSTLAAAAAAGATAITVQPGTSRSPLTFAAGDTVTVGSPAETDHIVSVSGTTLTLKTPLAQAHPAGASRDEHAGRHHR